MRNPADAASIPLILRSTIRTLTAESGSRSRRLVEDLRRVAFNAGPGMPPGNIGVGYRHSGRARFQAPLSTPHCKRIENVILKDHPWRAASGGMKRRTLKQLRFKMEPGHHHNVYVVLLDPAAGRLRAVRAVNPKRDPQKPCVYVGMTGLTPEERFENHRQGIKSAWVVKRYGLRLLPELFAHLNPMPFEAAVQMEQDLAEDLRQSGYTVTGGH
jgi:hypothetical protein